MGAAVGWKLPEWSFHRLDECVYGPAFFRHVRRPDVGFRARRVRPRLGLHANGPLRVSAFDRGIPGSGHPNALRASHRSERDRLPDLPDQFGGLSRPYPRRAPAWRWNAIRGGPT